MFTKIPGHVIQNIIIQNNSNIDFPVGIFSLIFLTELLYYEMFDYVEKL